MQRLIVGVATAVIFALFVVAAPQAVQSADCAGGGSEGFAADFVPLKEYVGVPMGDPMDCMRADGAGGDIVQPTTTGLAYRRSGGMPSFTTGREFWTLTPLGIQHWTGSLHTGMDPPAAEPSAGSLPMPEPGTYPTVEAVTVVQPSENGGDALIVQRGGHLYKIWSVPGCQMMTTPAGGTVFIRWPASAGEQTTDMLSPGNSACPISHTQEI